MKKTAVRTKRPEVPKETWEKVGDVGVDSGQLLVCDPCYIDSREWIRDQEPAGHPALILSDAGRLKFPELKRFSVQWPFKFPTGDSYEDMCPELGMSMNEARRLGLVEEVDIDPVRDFGYRGCCDVSHLTGNNFGQLNYAMGHAGAGVAFSSGYGDGCYPVYARRNAQGRVVEVRIVMETDPKILEQLGIK
jgi:hypothetical protein